MNGLAFDVGRHEYRFDGALVPSVTQVLAQVMNWAAVPEDLLAAGRTRGTAVHSLTEAHDQGEDVEWLVTDQTAPYFAAYRRFLDEARPQWDAIERRIYHPLHRYAGTLDRRGRLCGERAWVDIKTGSGHPAYALQLAAYVAADPERDHANLNPPRYSLYLCDDGSYRLARVETRQVDDFAVFLSLLNAARWKEKHHV